MPSTKPLSPGSSTQDKWSFLGAGQEKGKASSPQSVHRTSGTLRICFLSPLWGARHVEEHRNIEHTSVKVVPKNMRESEHRQITKTALKML